VDFVAGAKNTLRQWELHLGRPIEPTPKSNCVIANKDQWATTSVIAVPDLGLDLQTPFSEVVFQRRTIRSMMSLELEDVLGLIRLVMKPMQIGKGGNFGRTRKVTVSAGALHPIEALVVSGLSVVEPIIYNDAFDAFCTVSFCGMEDASTEIAAINSLIPGASGHLILFVANKRHVDQAYNDVASLLWRDAGAVLQTFALVASSFGYGFVPLGVSGSAVLSGLEAPHSDYIAVGTALIGRVQSHSDYQQLEV
jgi:hypothetical protein